MSKHRVGDIVKGVITMKDEDMMKLDLLEDSVPMEAAGDLMSGMSCH